METVAKMKFVRSFRSWLDKPLLKLPWPKINPDYVSALSLVVSVIFLFSSNLWWQILILFLVIFLDLADGLIAKKYSFRKTAVEKEKGWLADVVADRLSEGLVTVIYFMPFFILFVVNLFLSLWSFKNKKHLVLPLRHILLIYLLILAIF